MKSNNSARVNLREDKVSTKRQELVQTNKGMR